LLFSEGRKLAPDVVVWSISVGNDVTDESRAVPVHRSDVRTVTERLLDSSNVVRLLSRVGGRTWQNRNVLFPECRRNLDRSAPSSPRAGCGVRVRASGPYDPQAKSLTDDEFLTIGRDRLRAMYTGSQPDVITRLAQVAADRLVAAHDALAGVPVIFVVIPDEYQVSAVERARVLSANPELASAGLDFDFAHAILPADSPPVA
jgi:hypothetical protein